MASWIERYPWWFMGGVVGATLLLARIPFGSDEAPALVATPSVGRVTPPGPEYERQHLPAPPANYCEFVRSTRDLLARIGLTGPGADLFIAHLGRESGFGRTVYNYNWANIRSFAGSDAPWYRGVTGYPFRSYMSAAEGMRAMVDLIARPGGRYAPAWAKLQAGDVTWYATLGVLGYYEVKDANDRWVAATPDNVGPSQADYEISLRSVRRCR